MKLPFNSFIRFGAQALFLPLALYSTGCSDPLKDLGSYSASQRRFVEPSHAPAISPPKLSHQLPENHIQLEDLLSQAQQANNSLKAAQFRIGIAQGHTWQAGAYPNPTVQIGVDDLGFRDGMNSSETRIAVSQPIVIGSRLRAAVNAASAVESVRQTQLDLETQELFATIAGHHTQIINIRDRQILINKLIVLAERTHWIAQSRFEAKAASEPEAIRSRVEVIQLNSLLNQATRTISIAEQNIGLAVGLESISADRLAGTTELTPPALNELALKNAVLQTHPQLRVSDHQIQAAHARLKQIRAEATPNLELQAGVGYSEESDQGIAQIGIGMEIPLWNRNQGAIQSARFDILRLHQTRASLESALLAKFAQAFGQYEIARDQLTTLQNLILPDVQQAFDQTEQAYQAGSVPFIELLDAQRTLVQSRLRLLEYAGQAAMARVQIARVAGIELLLNHTQSLPSTNPDNTISAPNGAEETP